MSQYSGLGTINNPDMLKVIASLSGMLCVLLSSGDYAFVKTEAIPLSLRVKMISPTLHPSTSENSSCVLSFKYFVNSNKPGPLTSAPLAVFVATKLKRNLASVYNTVTSPHWKQAQLKIDVDMPFQVQPSIEE